MSNPLSAEFGGDNTHYSGHVTEWLSWDAYGCDEALLDDYADVEHLLAMREPVRVATAPGPYSAPRSYTCERCGAIRSNRSNHERVTLLCSDCLFVERHADPPPTRAAEQSIQALQCLTGNARAEVPAQKNSEATRHREARRLRRQREQYAQQLKDARKPKAKPPASRPRKPQQENLSPREAAERRQSEQERQFLQDLQDSGAEWLLKARHK